MQGEASPSRQLLNVLRPEMAPKNHLGARYSQVLEVLPILQYGGMKF